MLLTGAPVGYDRLRLQVVALKDSGFRSLWLLWNSRIREIWSSGQFAIMEERCGVLCGVRGFRWGFFLQGGFRPVRLCVLSLLYD